MSEPMSGVMSNGYAYEPMRDPGESMMRSIVESIGQSLGSLVGGRAGSVGATIGGLGGGMVADQAFVAYSNPDAILSNMKTFIAEINDWRTYAEIMSGH